MTYGFQNNFSKAIMVATKEQAKNIPVDFNGLPTFFYNQNANEVYLKQFDVATGSAIWKEFKAAEPEKQVNPFDEVNERLTKIEEALADRGGKK